MVKLDLLLGMSLVLPMILSAESVSWKGATSGAWVWDYEHTHFCFRVFDGEEDFWLDPWLVLRVGRRPRGSDGGHPAGVGEKAVKSLVKTQRIRCTPPRRV